MKFKRFLGNFQTSEQQCGVGTRATFLQRSLFSGVLVFALPGNIVSPVTTTLNSFVPQEALAQEEVSVDVPRAEEVCRIKIENNLFAGASSSQSFEKCLAEEVFLDKTQETSENKSGAPAETATQSIVTNENISDRADTVTETKPEEVQEQSAETGSNEDESYVQRKVLIEELTKKYPLYDMAGEIAQYDNAIAGLIVGIGKKESAWGQRSPRKGGQDCYNYWGFKGSGARGQALGYACFGSKEEAVERIGKRLTELTSKSQSTSPSRLVTPWKCGQSCASHSPESVQKWVSDVNQYYSKLVALAE